MAVMKTNDVSCGELLNTLLNAFTNTLTFVGIAWKQCWNGSVHDKLATEYNLSGLPTELVRLNYYNYQECQYTMFNIYIAYYV